MSSPAAPVVVLKKSILTLVVWGGLLVVLTPLVWMLLSAFKPSTEFASADPGFLPQAPTLANFIDALQGPTARMVLNSLLVTGMSTAVVLILGSMAGYSLARGAYRGREIFGRLILLTYLFPSLLMVVPLFILFNRFRLTDSLLGLTISYIGISLPFATWLLRAYFLAVPRELEAAAIMDGASRFAAFREIVLPQALPGVVAVGVFSFVQGWNEFLFAFVFISSPEKMTAPVGMNYYAGQLDVDWGPLMALAVIISVPVMALFLIGQRFIKSGVGIGAVKG